MSREAFTWVRSRSPLTGSSFCIHLLMADTVDKHCIVRMHQANLAAEARVSRMSVSRALSEMMKLGLLERVDTPEQETARRASHQPLRFRMLFPEVAVVIDDTDSMSQGVTSNQDDPDVSLSQGVTPPLEAPAEPLSHRVTSTPDPLSHPVTSAPDSMSQGVTSKEQELEKQQELSQQQELPTPRRPSIQKPTTIPADAPPPSGGEADGTLFPTPLRLVEPPAVANPRAIAKLILDPWWENQNPRPQQPYIAALKVLTKALASGWDERELAEALDSVPIISGGALDLWRNRQKGARRPAYGTGSKPAAQLAEESVTRLSKLMGYSQ